VTNTIKTLIIKIN